MLPRGRDPPEVVFVPGPGTVSAAPTIEAEATLAENPPTAEPETPAAPVVEAAPVEEAAPAGKGKAKCRPRWQRRLRKARLPRVKPNALVLPLYRPLSSQRLLQSQQHQRRLLSPHSRLQRAR